MRVAFMGLLLLVGCTPPPPTAALAPAPVPSVPDQEWVGTIECAAIPRYARIPLHQPFRLAVRNGVARYERNVRLADTSFDSGFQERGQGTVALDGTLELQGRGEARSSEFRSAYTGVLAGGHTTFDGVQHWRIGREPTFDRTCRLDLTRQL